jgi:error-prone DNA polymerase
LPLASRHPKLTRLRRAMATFKRVRTIGTFSTQDDRRHAGKGYERDFAERCFQQIEGFGEYGFPKATRRALRYWSNASAWLKCRYPDAFGAALLKRAADGFLRAGPDRARHA